MTVTGKLIAMFSDKGMHAVGAYTGTLQNMDSQLKCHDSECSMGLFAVFVADCTAAKQSARLHGYLPHKCKSGNTIQACGA